MAGWGLNDAGVLQRLQALQRPQQIRVIVLMMQVKTCSSIEGAGHIRHMQAQREAASF